MTEVEYMSELFLELRGQEPQTQFEHIWFFTETQFLRVNLIYSVQVFFLALNNVQYLLNAVLSSEFFPAACKLSYFQSICSVQGQNLVTSTLWRKASLAFLMASTVVLQHKLIITCWINEIIHQECDRNWCNESDSCNSNRQIAHAQKAHGASH